MANDTIQATQLRHNEHNVAVVMVHEDELPHYLNDIHEVFARLTPNHKGDYFRTSILTRYGGVYADSEQPALAPIWHYYRLLELHGMICMRSMPLSVGLFCV